MLSERLQTTMDIKNFVQCYLILLEVLEVTNNNAQEKSWQQCYLLLGQHCTGQNPMQCCPNNSRQYCTRKIMCNIDLILLKQQYTRKNTGNVVWSLSLHRYVRSFMSKKYMKLSFCYGNWLTS